MPKWRKENINCFKRSYSFCTTLRFTQVVKDHTILSLFKTHQTAVVAASVQL